MLNKVIEILDANSEETRHPQWGVVRLFSEDAILAAAEQILTLLQPNDAVQPNGSKPVVSGALLAEMHNIRSLALQKQENHKQQGLSESYIEATACISVIDHLLKFIQQ